MKQSEYILREFQRRALQKMEGKVFKLIRDAGPQHPTPQEKKVVHLYSTTPQGVA